MKKTNKLISILLVLAMLLSMAPMTVLAADGHTHALSADGETVEFAELPADTTKITAAGSYYLTQDIELNSEFQIEVEGTVNLCLNGHSITATADNSNDVVIFINSGTLNLCDCQGGGCITSAEDLSFSGVTVWSGAVFNMYGGEIKDNAYYAVKGANFNMYGGKLSGNKKSAVYVTNTFNMYGGEISGNVKSYLGGVAVEVNSGNFNMYGGEIKNNENISSSYINASIVGVNDGATFTMYDGKICDNKGKAVYCDGSFIMNSGEISGNDDDYVGGVYVNTGNFNMNGGEIKNNKGKYAGGIYIENNGVLNIKAGKIIGNSASLGNISSTGGGIGLSNGSVVLSGADIQIKDNVNTETSSSSNQNVARNVVFKVAAPLDPAKTQIAFDLKEAVFARPDGTNLTTLSGMEKCFISPSEELFVVCNEDGELETTYWSSSIKEKDGDFVVTVSADSGVTYQWYQADGEELTMLEGETSNKLTNDKLVVGKTYFCKIYYNGQEIETLTIGYPYKITHQPTAEEPYVALNDNTDATYQWNTVEGGKDEVTDDGDIGDYYGDSYYDAETGWNGDWWSDYGADYFYVYLEEGQKITIIPSAYCEKICIWDCDTDEYGKDAECEADEKFTYIAEVDGWYYVYAYTDYYDYTTLRAYIGDADYTEIEGETAAELKNAEFGKMYACEVTFADGTTEMSDVIDLSYKITHQPTAGEPYVELNDDTDATYRWYTVEDNVVEITNANAETVSYDWGESSYDKETGWTGVPYEEDYYGQDFFTVELEAGETITVEVTGDFADGVGIWDYDTENDDWANAEEDVTSYELTAESAGNYTFYTYVNSGVVTVKAYKNSIDYTEIDGETASKLENAEFGKNYACEVTFADGTTEMSDSFKNTYAIIHQPTANEPYVELNDDTDAAYQWNTVELAEEITSENAADETGYYGEEFDYSAITGWEGIPYDSYGGYDYFAVELEEDETITVVVNGEFDDDIGIWDYDGDDGVYCYSNSENVYTFTAPYTATYWLYIDGANDDVTVKAYYGHGNIYTKIDGETEDTLIPEAIGNYACEVTFADGTTEMSDYFEVTTLHTHSFTYSASGDTITAVCENANGYCSDTNGGTLIISAPAELYADGTTAKEATVENNLVDTSVAVNVTYSTADGNAPTNSGTYTASVTVGGVTASVQFTLLNYAAKVTDTDGNALEGSPYKTLADAIAAASASENSTLTLLDDVTLTDILEINSGKFTFDLNGNTLINPNGIEIGSSAELTVVDSASDGKIFGNMFCFLNDGSLTINGGIIDASCAVYNYGTVKIVDGDMHGYITNNGKVTVNGGTLTHIKNVNTSYESVLEINGGIFTDANTIENSDGKITVKGGEYPNGFSVTNDGILDYTVNSILADGYHFRDADGKIIEVADDATVIDGYVKVTKGADISEAIITIDNTEFTYNGDEISPTVIVTVGGKALIEGKDYTLAYKDNVNAGLATVTVTADSDGSYTGEVTRKYNIAPATVDIIWEGDSFYYTGNPCTVTANYIDVNGNEIPAAITQNETNTEIGNYIATATVEDSNYIVNGATINHVYEIKWYDGAPDAAVSGTKGENGWYTSAVTVTAPADYEIGKTVDGEYSQSVTFENEENAVCYLKQAETGYIAKFELGELKSDLADPTAEIVLAENKWNSFINTVTFGKFFKETQSVTITASDETSKLAKTEYIVATEEITDFENAEWIEYTEAFTIEPDSKNIIYAKATDNAGRYVIVNSDGIVVYTDSTLDTSVKEEVVYVLTKNAEQSFTLNLNGNTVAYVMIDETVLGAGDYEVLDNMVFVSAEVLENLTAGEYVITVGVNPMGEAFAEGDAPAEVTIPLTVKKADVTVEINGFGKTYDGKSVTAEYEISKSSDSSPAVSNIDYNESVEFKVKGADDSTYTAEAPVNAGEYTVRITVAETDKINFAEATADFTIAKKPVTVTATAPDKIYDGTINLDLSKVTVTFDGLADSDTIEYEVLGGSYLKADAGKNINVAISYDVDEESSNNYDLEYGMVTVPEAKHTVMTKANILPKDISDGFIILGEALTYNGKEQTQTVEKVVATGTASEVTYTVNGNKATNVGVYLLTVTGTGNFTGEAKLAYEIALDDNCISHLDRVEDNGEMKWNVKSTDRESLEYVVAQLDNAVTDIADADKKNEWADIKESCEDMLRIINSIELFIADVEEDYAEFDIGTVKSSDVPALDKLVSKVNEIKDRYGFNLTDEEAKKLEDILDGIEKLKAKIDDTAKEIERIENAVNGYNEETVKSSDEEAINNLKDNIQTLIDSGNVTGEEIAALEDTKADADALTDKIDETQAEIDRINDEVAGYDEETIKSTDKEAVEKLKEDIQTLVDSGNVTEEEIAGLEDTNADADALTDKIKEIEKQLEEIADIENGYDPEKVTSDDKSAIEDKIAEIDAVNPNNLTEEQKAEYKEIRESLEALLDDIAAAEKSVADIGAEIGMFDENRVTKFWEDDIESLKAKIDELLADENISTAEKAKLNEYKEQTEKLIEIINTPKEYISCRFFYFIWDCLNWKCNGIRWIFSQFFRF